MVLKRYLAYRTFSNVNCTTMRVVYPNVHTLIKSLRSLAVTTVGDGCRFLNLCWFKNTDQSWMQTSCRCLYAFLTCRRRSCFTHDVMRHHHWRVSSWVMWLRMFRATTSLPKQPFAFFIFTALFSWITNKNLQQHHCSSFAMHWGW